MEQIQFGVVTWWDALNCCWKLAVLAVLVVMAVMAVMGAAAAGLVLLFLLVVLTWGDVQKSVGAGGHKTKRKEQSSHGD